MEKVEIVLFQQIAGPVAAPAPAPAPAELSRAIVGLPVTPSNALPGLVPIGAPAAAPVTTPTKTVIIASVVAVVSASGAELHPMNASMLF